MVTLWVLPTTSIFYYSGEDITGSAHWPSSKVISVPLSVRGLFGPLVLRKASEAGGSPLPRYKVIGPNKQLNELGLPPGLHQWRCWGDWGGLCGWEGMTDWGLKEAQIILI